jgi:transposase-like protein
MSGSALSAKFFHDEAAAYTKLESLLWPDGPVCPRCGCLDRITVVSGKTARMGLKRCGHCKRQFTVTVGTVFESSHVKLNLWLQASHMLCTSKKGMSSHQIHRTLGVTYKTAWFMTHRLREAMRSGEFVPFGGNGNIVEVDETFIGQKNDMPKRRGYAHKHAILLDNRPTQVRAAGRTDVHSLDESVQRGDRIAFARDDTRPTQPPKLSADACVAYDGTSHRASLSAGP